MLEIIFFNYGDWTGYLILTLGLLLVGQKKRDGWFLCLAGSILLGIWGLSLKHYGIVFWNILFSLIYTYNYFKHEKIRKYLKKIEER